MPVLAMLTEPANAQEPFLSTHLSTTMDFRDGLTSHSRTDVPVVIDGAAGCYQAERLSCVAGTASDLVAVTACGPARAFPTADDADPRVCTKPEPRGTW